MLSAVFLVVMLRVVPQSVVILIVVAPTNGLKKSNLYLGFVCHFTPGACTIKLFTAVIVAVS
jgi:hypothetical protein